MLWNCSFWILVTHKWLKQLELTWVISAHHMCQQNQMHFLSAIGPSLRCRQMVLAPTRSKGHSHCYKAHECGSRMGWILLDASKAVWDLAGYCEGMPRGKIMWTGHPEVHTALVHRVEHSEGEQQWWQQLPMPTEDQKLYLLLSPHTQALGTINAIVTSEAWG